MDQEKSAFEIALSCMPLVHSWIIAKLVKFDSISHIFISNML